MKIIYSMLLVIVFVMHASTSCNNDDSNEGACDLGCDPWGKCKCYDTTEKICNDKNGEFFIDESCKDLGFYK